MVLNLTRFYVNKPFFKRRENKKGNHHSHYLIEIFLAIMRIKKNFFVPNMCSDKRKKESKRM